LTGRGSLGGEPESLPEATCGLSSADVDERLPYPYKLLVQLEKVKNLKIRWNQISKTLEFIEHTAYTIWFGESLIHFVAFADRLEGHHCDYASSMFGGLTGLENLY
jgi:hypothetical protein